MKPVFLDTGYLIALEAGDDQNHEAARRHWERFSRRLPRLVTTSMVLTEAVTFFNTRGQHSKAVEIGNMLLESPAVTLVQVNEPLLLMRGSIFSNTATSPIPLWIALRSW